MQFNYANIPKELRDLKQWGNFELKYVPARHKNTKIPINPYDGTNGKSNDPATWSDFKTAYQSLNNIPRAKGLAFYFTNGYVGLDIDNIEDDLETWAEGNRDENNLIVKFQKLTHDTYMEISQSGKGIHAIFKGKIIGKHRRKGHFEMYQSGRFFALTGNTIGKPNAKIETLSDKDMQVLYETIFGSDKVTPQFSGTTGNVDLPVSEIISKAEASPRSGERFKLFMNGGWDKFYLSQSEADMAFANDLAFWTGRDFQKMDTIFRNSSLIRDKWDRKTGGSTYGAITLQKAINECTSTYNPQTESDIDSNDSRFAWNKKATKPKEFRSWDDTGMADRFIDMYGNNRFRYLSGDKRWFYYDNNVWRTDSSGVLGKAIDVVADSLKKEKIQIPKDADEKEEKAIMRSWEQFKHRAHMSSGHRDLATMLKHRLTVTHEDWDKDDYFLNTPSGYVDLKTGQLHDHKAELMFSHITSVEFTDNIDCPEWIDFLNQIFQGDQDLIHYVQKMLGYALIGTTREQTMFILFGNGRNGKSVFLNTVQYILGSYVKTMDVSAIMSKQINSGPTPELARLQTARMVITSEANEGNRLNEGLVKQMTGGDMITARFNFGDVFEFKPKFTILMATNHKPIIRGTDMGIWRRLALIPFDYTVPEDQVDPALESKLRRESCGILNWMVEGTIYYLVEGLKQPQAVIDASAEYRSEMDVLAAFIEEQCEVDDEYHEKSTALFEAYVEWAKGTNNYSRMSNTKFGREMSNRFQKIHTRNGAEYAGIRLKSDSRFDWNKEK